MTSVMSSQGRVRGDCHTHASRSEDRTDLKALTLRKAQRTGGAHGANYLSTTHPCSLSGAHPGTHCSDVSLWRRPLSPEVWGGATTAPGPTLPAANRCSFCQVGLRMADGLILQRARKTSHRWKALRPGATSGPTVILGAVSCRPAGGVFLEVMGRQSLGVGLFQKWKRAALGTGGLEVGRSRTAYTSEGHVVPSGIPLKR